MEVRKNNLCLYLLIAVFGFTFFVGYANASEYENYYGITMTNQQYNNLLNLGFSENEIYYMNQDTFDLNKDIQSTLVAENTKYYKTIYTNLNGDTYSMEITKDEYDNQSLIDPRGTVNTEYKNMVSTMSQSNNMFRYKVTVGWNKFPSTRSYDIIGVGYEDAVSITGGVYFWYTYANSSGEYTTESLYYDKKNTSTGGSAVYKLPSGTIRSLSAVLYYDVTKNTSSTITSLEMCGDYSHATSNVSSSQAANHEITINGIELGSSVYSYYDAIPCAISSWSGSW